MGGHSRVYPFALETVEHIVLEWVLVELESEHLSPKLGFLYNKPTLVVGLLDLDTNLHVSTITSCYCYLDNQFVGPYIVPLFQTDE